MAVENTRDGRRFDRSYLVFGRMAELSGCSIIIGHEEIFKKIGKIAIFVGNKYTSSLAVIKGGEDYDIMLQSELDIS